MKIENNLPENNVRVRLLFMYCVSWNLTEKENSCHKREEWSPAVDKIFVEQSEPPEENKEADKQTSKAKEGNYTEQVSNATRMVVTWASLYDADSADQPSASNRIQRLVYDESGRMWKEASVA